MSFSNASLCAAVSVGLLLGCSVSAGTCPGIDVTIEGQSDLKNAVLCEAVSDALELLDHCGLTQLHPLRIKVVDGPIAGSPSCIGFCHANSNTIEILKQQQLAKALGADHPLLLAPIAEVYSSFITHEITHALLFQNMEPKPDITAEHEFVAYAMQFKSISPANREAIIESFPEPQNRIEQANLNDTILWAAPMLFAVRSWQYFDELEDGCAFIARLVEGKVDFSPGVHTCSRPPCD